MSRKPAKKRSIDKTQESDYGFEWGLFTIPPKDHESPDTEEVRPLKKAKPNLEEILTLGRSIIADKETTKKNRWEAAVASWEKSIVARIGETQDEDWYESIAKLFDSGTEIFVGGIPIESHRYHDRKISRFMKRGIFSAFAQTDFASAIVPDLVEINHTLRSDGKDGLFLDIDISPK